MSADISKRLDKLFGLSLDVIEDILCNDGDNDRKLSVAKEIMSYKLSKKSGGGGGGVTVNLNMDNVLGSLKQMRNITKKPEEIEGKQ